MVEKEWQLVKQFMIPAELKDGIIYCQRALRDCVLQHQNLGSQINMLPVHQRVKAKQFMLEIEGEMLEIGHEQGALFGDLRSRLKQFRTHVHRKSRIEIRDDIANGYVTRLLNSHNELTGVINRTPINCSYRLSASDLAEKYCLETIVKLEKFVDDDDASFAPWSTREQQQQRKIQQSKKPKKATKTYLKASSGRTHPSPASLSPSPETSSVSRSLLKPKQERLEHSKQSPPESTQGVLVSREPRAFASVVKAEEENATREVEAKANGKIEIGDDDATATTSKTAVVRSAASTQQQIYPRPGGTWMPGLRGRPPKGVNYIPANKLAIIKAHQRNYFLRKLQKQKLGVRKLEECGKASPSTPGTSSPPEEIDPEQYPESSEEQRTPAALRRPSAAVRRGRNNLLQALNKLKRPSLVGEDANMCFPPSAPRRGRKPKTTVAKNQMKNCSSGSSGSSPNSRSSTPTLPICQLVASDDSSDRRGEGSLDPLPTIEPEQPQPNNILELGLPAFLHYFELCTPEEAKARRERRQERKRRSCYSTERKDFHYGRLDYYEQQQLQAASRASKRPNQRPILYSPPVAVAKKRKHHQQQQPHQQQQRSPVSFVRPTSNTITSRHRLPMRCMSLDSRDIFAAMAKRSCFVCQKTGSTDELSACTNCCNIYHLDCHRIEDDDDVQLVRQRDNLCPVCLTAEDGDK